MTLAYLHVNTIFNKILGELRRLLMTFTFTARHFKAHDTLKEFAEAETHKFTKHFDGVISTEVILDYDKPENSVKNAEVIVHAKNNHIFKAKESSDDFMKSIEAAMNKIVTQIRKHRDKQTNHNNGDKVVDHLKDTEE
jgi:putative sigma-54 modulation protein